MCVCMYPSVSPSLTLTPHSAHTQVSPAASSADHTMNTLRYADRIKERKVGGVPRPANNANNNNNVLNANSANSANSNNSNKDARENVMPPPVPAANSRAAAALASANAAKKADVRSDAKADPVRRSNDYKAADQVRASLRLYICVRVSL